jgi:hypothetical protein
MSAGGWFVIDKSGRQEGIYDKRGAHYFAEMNAREYPSFAPHRAVQLVELTPQLAAAGDVLEALRDAEARLTVAIDQDRHKLLDVVARDKARTAIAKATGQEGGAA